ncbi:MAG: family 20 glycosylhydrolase [Victivallaceae bacterium]|nr:family 20 glycosylhydrolase [Victivallaceae bacterium]
MNINRPARMIYPEPKQVKWQEGTLRIDKPQVLTLPGNSQCADFFAETWRNFTSGTSVVTINAAALPANTFTLAAEKSPALPDLAGKSTYALKIDTQGIAAKAADETALRQAWLSMLQMLNARPGAREISGFQIPCAEIQDYPLMKFRSAHLCIFPETSLKALEKSIQLLGMYKYTHVVLEFWGMLKLDALPELAWPQAYSKDQVRPLLQLIRDLGMKPIPMFNHWGHATASRVRCGRHVVLDQNPLFEPLFEPDGWTWCLSSPETLKLLAEVRRELIEFFGEVEYFHLGCDEAYSHATCDACRQHDPAELLAEYLNAVNTDLKNRNIRPFIWGDALLDASCWNGYIALSRADQRTHEALELLSRDFIIADWQYGIQDKTQNATVKHFMEHGFDVVTAPWHDTLNIDALGEIAIEQNAFGMMLTTWHTLPVHIDILFHAGNIMWGGKNAGSNNPQYSRTSITSQAAFLRKIRKGPAAFADAGWRSFETVEIKEP